MTTSSIWTNWTKVFKGYIVCAVLSLLQESFVECRGRGGRYRGGGGVSSGASGYWWIGLVAGGCLVVFLIILIIVLRWYYFKHGHYCCTKPASTPA